MNITKNRKLPKVDRRHNLINGHDAEVLAKSKFILAVSGEINSTSRELDNNKLDFNMNFMHPWKTEQLIQFCQVKSGDAYGEEKPDYAFETKKSLIEQLKKTTTSVCLIWVNRDTNNLFWVYIHSKSDSDKIYFAKQHKITPATRFDLARCFEKLNSSNYSNIGAKGITIKELSKSYTENRDYAKKKYTILKNSKIESPILGLISCTNTAWKHISRRNRKKQFKTTSFNTVDYLYKILSSLPDSIAVLNCKYSDIKERTWRETEYILKFKNATLNVKHTDLEGKKTNKKKKVTIVVRIVETIVYPINWQNESQLSQMINRKVMLKSFYYKIEKEKEAETEKEIEKEIP